MKDHQFFALLLAVIGLMSGLCVKDAQTTAVAAGAELGEFQTGFLYLTDVPLN